METKYFTELRFKKTSEVPKKENEWLSTLEELVEKATPKKPTWEYLWTGRGEGYLGEPIGEFACCPTCGFTTEIEINDLPLDEKQLAYNSFCPCCGQALDWSEE